MKKEMHYTFDEWMKLDSKSRRLIINEWNPYQNDRKHETQSNLVAGFKDQYSSISSNFLAAGFGFFGWQVPCIYVVVSDSKIRLPQIFDGFLLNKGIIKEEIGDHKFVIKWRYGSSKSLIEINNSEINALGLYKFRDRRSPKTSEDQHL